MDAGIVEIVCVVVGAAIAILTDIVWNWYNQKKNEKHNARLLYYDLKSVTKYVLHHVIYEDKTFLSIRYNTDWQIVLMELENLNLEQVELIYDFYDAVYDYNEMKNMEKLKELEQFVKNSKFKNMINSVKVKAKISNDTKES